jgi:hypothetical protein
MIALEATSTDAPDPLVSIRTSRVAPHSRLGRGLLVVKALGVLILI